jgi:hypothetical protein
VASQGISRIILRYNRQVTSSDAADASNVFAWSTHPAAADLGLLRAQISAAVRPVLAEGIRKAKGMFNRLEAQSVRTITDANKIVRTMQLTMARAAASNAVASARQGGFDPVATAALIRRAAYTARLVAKQRGQMLLREASGVARSLREEATTGVHRRLQVGACRMVCKMRRPRCILVLVVLTGA